METQPVNSNDLLIARRKLNQKLTDGYMLLARYVKAKADRVLLLTNNEELKDPNANLLTALGVLLIIGLIAFFQANNDGAMIAESIMGNTVSAENGYPWYTYGFGAGIALFGFFVAKGAAPRYRFVYDKFGERKLSSKWLWAIAATLFYLVIHILIGLYIYDQAGEAGHFAAFWPFILSMIDVFLAMTFGVIVLLTLRLTWYDIKIAWLFRRLNKAAQQIVEAGEYVSLVVQKYNQSKSVNDWVDLTADKAAVFDFLSHFRRQLDLLSVISDSKDPSKDDTLALSDGEKK